MKYTFMVELSLELAAVFHVSCSVLNSSDTTRLYCSVNIRGNRQI